mgnify:CR=1 FL=1
MAQFLAVYPPSVWLVLIATGVLIGLLAGLLGVGGGVVAVPVLLDLFPAIAVAQPVSLPLALGTAQASIVIASVAAAYAQAETRFKDILGVLVEELPQLKSAVRAPRWRPHGPVACRMMDAVCH